MDLMSLDCDSSHSFWRLGIRTTSLSRLIGCHGGVVTVAEGCAVCHGGVWFAQGRQARSTAPRDATPRFAPPRSAPQRQSNHREAPSGASLTTHH